MKQKEALGIALGCLTLFSSCDTGEDKKPNIIFINVDDLGWKDLGVYGSGYYLTPNIDRLAQEGMLFTDAYAAAANCAPSRACLMTGMYTPRHGIYTVNSSERGKSNTRKLIPEPNTTVLKEEFVSIAEQFQTAGYKCISIGKWHLGDDPRLQGFEQNIAGTKLGHPKSYFSPYKNRNLPDGPPGENLTDRLTDESIRFIRESKDNTFFLYLPYFTVHTPLQGKDEIISKYAEKAGNEEQNNPVYAAMIETLDVNIGRILAVLDSLALRENTMIILTSDNGGVCRISSQAPLRAGKGSYYEGGIRVPLLVSWPGKIKQESVCKTAVSNIDFYPTLLGVAGISETEAINLDGVDLSPILFQNGAFAERPLFWHFPIYLEAYGNGTCQVRDPLFRTRPGSVVRSGNWKLHEYFEDGGIELYNLENDPGEQINLAETEAEKVNELLEILNTWREETGAPVPTALNPEYFQN